MPTTYAIPNGRTVMDATAFTSTGTTQQVINSDNGTNGFYPDLLWVKPRNITANHQLSDSVRGTGTILFSNLTNVDTSAPNYLNSFNANGFTFGTGQYSSGNTIVAWQWNAGSGTTSSNTNGSITSTVSVNAAAGFSIVTYTGTGANATVGHGLGAVPQFIIIKSRTVVQNWIVYHVSTGNTSALLLNLTNAPDTNSVYWNNTTPTSSVFSLGANLAGNTSGATNVAYCWAQVPGFSQFGSYTGNASTSGPFIYTGFRPKFVLIKNTANVGSDWIIYDSSRNTYNSANYLLFPDTSAAELTSSSTVNVNLLSNGFNIVGTDGGINGNGTTYIYATFAENPFKYANAR